VILTCYNHPAFIKLFAITPEESGVVLNGRIRTLQLDWDQGYLLIATQTRIFIYSFISQAAIKRDYPKLFGKFRAKWEVIRKKAMGAETVEGGEEGVNAVLEEGSEAAPNLDDTKDFDDLMDQLVCFSS
jgi:hypothetical protein